MELLYITIWTTVAPVSDIDDVGVRVYVTRVYKKKHPERTYRN